MRAPKKPISVLAGDKLYTLMHGEEALRTPAGTAVTVPAENLAKALATEWNGQGEKIDPASMPLNQLAMTAIDVVAKGHTDAIDSLARFATAELLCHRAESPSKLAERQQRAWQPLLDWCTQRFHAPLVAAEGLMPIKQPPDSIATLQSAIKAYDVFRLAGLKQAVEVTGSLVLGLALAEGHINAGAAFEAAELDADFQSETWGEDPARAARRSGIRRDLELCERWFGLLK